MEGSPNSFAWLALIAAPLIIVAVYARLPRGARVARTTAWVMLLSVMFLPSGLRLKTAGIPYLDKHRLAFLAIAAGLYLFHRERLLRRAPAHWFPRAILAIMILGVIETVRTNGDVLTFGPTVLPALTRYDIVSVTGEILLDVYLPFTIGQRVFQGEEDVTDLLEVMSRCGLIYAPLCLFEVRFSPQLHRWVYGTHASQFLQAMRYGGFRPVVFMNHGLSVAMFMFTCFAAAVGLRGARAAGRGSLSPTVRAAVVGGVLLLSKSLAAALYSTFALLMGFVSSTKALSRILLFVSLLVVIYPVTRATHLLPTAWLASQFAGVSAERADSLEYRLSNEDQLIERWAQRPWFGWGTFGRSRIYSSWGQDMSTTDGEWIIWLGAFGVVGVCSLFALLLAPVLRFVRHHKSVARREAVLLGALALIVTMFAVDLLPNALSDFLPLAYAGALFTASERCARMRRVIRRRGVSRGREAPDLVTSQA